MGPIVSKSNSVSSSFEDFSLNKNWPSGLGDSAAVGLIRNDTICEESFEESDVVVDTSQLIEGKEDS